jgi:Flp pilus assembly protein TadG
MRHVIRALNVDNAGASGRRKNQDPEKLGRRGKILVFLAILLPVLCGFVGLVMDSSLLMADYRNIQQACDAAATTAAMSILTGGTTADATAAAVACVQSYNAMATANVVVNIPPQSGPNAGNSAYAEVFVSQQVTTNFIQVIGASSLQTVSVRSVAGALTSTSGGVIDLLDPNPPGITLNLSPLVSLSVSLPPLELGGLEVLGLGQLSVNGAILDNNQWGGVDQNGNPAGSGPAPPYGAACTPLVPLTAVAARNIRVVGGVDNPKYYTSFVSGQSSPLHCNMLPVPDPYANLPSPTVSSDPANVVAIDRGGVNVVAVPLIGTPTVLNPGVYDWIQVTSGTVIFNPGVYIIRNVNPVTQLALAVIAGQVTAKGVTFYITNATDYAATTGAPDSGDGNTVPPGGSLGTLLPSVVITSLLGSTYTPISDSGSPFNGILIYQRRVDRRPIVLADETIVLGGTLSGTVYAKYAQVVFAVNGTYDLKFVVGSMAFANVLQCTLNPSQLLPAAQDVFLVE